MSRRDSPNLDSRRAEEFRGELMARARAWVRNWSLGETPGDFAVALMDVAARFSSQVSERLDRAGEKLSLGLLDWLAVRGNAAKPARMPVAFKLADTARTTVLARKPVRLQADVDGASVAFETETDVTLVPGTLQMLVGVDAGKDEYYLAPPGLTSLDPVEPLPEQWRVKSFADAGATHVQLDPALGIAPDMLLELGGRQYRVLAVEGDLVSVDPPLDAGGIAAGSVVTKVTRFDPFGTAVRNQQQHALYLGDDDLFNLEAPSVLQIRGAGQKLSNSTWEYFGKSATDDSPAWRELPKGDASLQGGDKLTLLKPMGAVESVKVGAVQTRWLRARQVQVDDETQILSSEDIRVVINPGADNIDCPPSGVEAEPGAQAEGFVNTQALEFTAAFYPLGREPKQFDTFYLGCADAFSKSGASVSMCFEMSNPVSSAFATIGEGRYQYRLLAAVGGDGALHLFELNTTSGTLSKFANHDALQPKAASGNSITLDTKLPYRPPAWAVNDDQSVPTPAALLFPTGGFPFNLFQDPFFVATTAGTEVWVWKEYPNFPVFSRWIKFNELPAAAGNVQVDGLVYLRTNDSVATSRLYATLDGNLYRHSAVEARAAEAWEQVPLTNAPPPHAVNGAYKLERIAPVMRIDAQERWHGSLTDGLVALFKNDVDALAYLVDEDGNCDQVDNATASVKGTQPAAVRIGNTIHVFWQQAESPLRLRMARLSSAAHNLQGTADSPAGSEFDLLAGGALEIPPTTTTATVVATGRKNADSAVITWTAHPANQISYFETKLPAGVGPLNGAPTVLGKHIVAPGTQSDALVASWEPGLRRRIQVVLQSGLVVPDSVAAYAVNDWVAWVDGASLELTTFLDTGNAAGGERLYELDDDIGIGHPDGQLMTYRRTAPKTGDSAAAGSTDLLLENGDTSVAENQYLMVDAPNGLDLYRIDTVTAGNPRWTVKLDPDPGFAVSTQYTYWKPETPGGRLSPRFKLNTSTGDFEASLLERVDLAFESGSPRRQRGKAFQFDGTQPRLVALNANWTQKPVAPVFFTLDAAIGAWSRQFGGAPTNPELVWEFFNGRFWDQLDLERDETQDLKRTGKLKFEVPATLAPTEVNSKPNHWIRARLLSGDYGREKVSVVTRPDPNNSSATIQEVVRDTSDFHPPLVVNLRIRYSVSNAALPTHLLTQDSGSLRDQSDANRTPGALVEAFVPLGVQMRRLTRGSEATPSASGSACCDCSPAAAAPASTVQAVTSDARAVLLGFNAGLSGESVNVLLLVDEKSHDALAPLAVEALVNDRFEPVTVKDTTRALGESGLLSMAFPVKPSPRDLFGHTLTWLKLSPSRASADVDWQPVIRGAYLNAAWARATETLTREPLGSSDGRPRLTLRVARPPLLQDSLELRVREPLDKEEREALLAADTGPAPDSRSVKFDLSDLPGDWVLWRQVPDPADYGPEDRVYALDETLGEVVFGDGIHGMIPPIGRDAVVAFKYQRTEPAADGGDSVPANQVAARTALNLVTPVESVEAAFAAEHAAGGSPPENTDRVLRFGNARLRHRERAIVLRDFEDLALASSPDIAQARAFKHGGNIRLVVVMRGPDPQPSAAQRRALHARLLDSATPLLGEGSALEVAGPRVRDLRISLDLTVASLDDAGVTAEDAGKALARFFDSAIGGADGTGWPLGAAPADDDIACALAEVHGIEGIAGIRLAEVAADGSELPWRPTVRADELVMLATDSLRFKFESLEEVA